MRTYKEQRLHNLVESDVDIQRIDKAIKDREWERAVNEKTTHLLAEIDQLHVRGLLDARRRLTDEIVEHDRRRADLDEIEAKLSQARKRAEALIEGLPAESALMKERSK